MSILDFLRPRTLAPRIEQAAKLIQAIANAAQSVSEFRSRMREAVDRGDFDDVVSKAKESDDDVHKFLRGGQ